MRLVLGVALMMALCVPAARGQADPQVRVVMKGDSAYVYHTELLPPGYGVNLYRIEGSGEAVLVSEEPATAVQTGEEFAVAVGRSEEHTSELKSRGHLVCRLLLGKKNER